MEDLVERAKGLKKKEGRKGGKRKKSWVEKQKKKTGRAELNDEVSKQFSKANIIYLFLSLTKFPLFANFYIVMANNNNNNNIFSHIGTWFCS